MFQSFEVKFGLHLQKKYFWFPEIIKKQGEGVPDLVHVMRTLATESIPNLPPGGELASKWVHIDVNVVFALNQNLTVRPLLKGGGGERRVQDKRWWSVLQFLLLSCSEQKAQAEDHS